MSIERRPWVAPGFVVVLAADLEALERENAKMKAALGKIYSYMKEEWADEYFYDSACLFTYLKEGGVEIPCRGKPYDPEGAKE